MFSNITSVFSRLIIATALATSTLIPIGQASAGSSAHFGQPVQQAALSIPVGAQPLHQPLPRGLGAAFQVARFAFTFAGEAYRHALAGTAGIDTTNITKATPSLLSRQPGRRGSEASDVFGSKALAFRRLPALEKLKASYGPDGRNGLLDCGVRECSSAESLLSGELGDLAEATLTRKAAVVNTAVNRLVSYRKDVDQYGTLDYWATPRETLKQRAGDCEDYAILKMALLEELGIPASSMSVVVLKDERRSLFHAILALRTRQGFLVLDNMHDRVLRDIELPHYLPYYSLSEGKAFIHGRKVGSGKTMASANLRAIAPGEGPAATDEGDRAE